MSSDPIERACGVVSYSAITVPDEEDAPEPSRLSIVQPVDTSRLHESVVAGIWRIIYEDSGDP